jgi:tRNA (cmo5U34)-methyltransferase
VLASSGRSLPRSCPPGGGTVSNVITAVQCHQYLSRGERARAVKACFDLLAPGGDVRTYENIRPLTNEGTTIGRRNWQRFLEEKREVTRGGRGPPPPGSTPKTFPTRWREHIDLLRQTGFRTVELLWYSYMQAGFYCLR